MLLRPSLVANNSQESTTTPAETADFTSFPGLPDPEYEKSQTLTKLFTKTLRRVTNNASNIVQSYSSPKSIHSNDANDSLDLNGNSPVRVPVLDNIQTDEIQDGHRRLQESLEKMSNKSDSKSSLALPPAIGMTSSGGGGGSSTGGTNKSHSGDSITGNMLPSESQLATIQQEEREMPTVTSDTKTLRFSSNSVPVLESATSGATNKVVNVNALASTDTDVLNNSGKNTPPIITTSLSDADNSSLTKKSSKKTLLNRISSIFNNLPNDIELSDDSASDTETVHESGMDYSAQSSPSHLESQYHLNNGKIRNANNNSNNNKPGSTAGAIPPPELSMYSESVVKSSPVKAEQLRKFNNDTSPTLSSVNALKHFNDSPMKKKPSNLSSTLIDNAKSIINQNFHGTVSSASSVIEKSKRRKKKAKRISENPLKSGGIPRKYWMNDAFVSECINCFKPFTAFRRKHHCRFCGQIFCSQCTLFVSYEQHKEQRRTGVVIHDNGHYTDKLRVCKPCYSDVIVYLSDSNSSDSEFSEDDEEAISLEVSDQLKPPEDNLPQHPFSRSRSMSTNSRRSDIFPTESNRIFFNKPSVTDSSSERYPSLTMSDRNSMKAPPSISIPTTRKGESMEILVSKSNNSFLNSNSPQLNVEGKSLEPSSNGWLKNYPHLRRQNGSNVQKSSSYDNLSRVHGFIGASKLSRNKSHTEVDGLRRIRNGKLENLPDESSDGSNAETEREDDDDDELESENEDEQVMSLYTSLNHGGFNSNISSSTISPRAPIARPLATVSANAVPTLGEFPTMMVNEKLYPKNMSNNIRTSPAGTVFPRLIPSSGKATDEHTISSDGSPFSRNILDDSPKSNLRSHERAHASLLRMRSRRKAKTIRNVLHLSQKGTRLPQLEFADIRDSSSPVSTPTSPTPGGGPSGNYFKASSSETVIQQPSGQSDNISPDRDAMTDIIQTRHQASYGSLDNNVSKDSILPGKEFSSQESGLFEEEGRRIDVVYLDIFKKILLQCLEDCDIKNNIDRWAAALTRTISFVNGLGLTDTLDIKQYVKVKKIPGGKIKNTDVIEGVLMTKNIDSKRMASLFDNPKIALLMFPIEYLKQKEQFISLRIVQSQQTVYITNLVSRLISLEPDVIVVGDTVCQLAKDLLEEANITVISNTKPQVIERISRYTKGDIFQSVNDLFFKKGSLGTCKKFEVKRFLFHNVLKTFVSFTGTDSQLGFTIALRGGDEETLNSIKYTTENLLMTQINAKFERSFFEDHFLVFQEDLPQESVTIISNRINNIKDEVINGDSTEPEVFPDEKEVFEYIELMNLRQISTSPASKFSLPTPLTGAIEAYINYYGYNKKHNLLKSCNSLDDVEMSLIEELKLNIDVDKLPNKSDDLLMFLKYTSDIKVKNLLSQYQSRARSWSNYMKLPSYQLYPIFHKSIHLLHSNVSMKFNTPCSGPNIIVVDYYTDNDKCLGLQLDQMFSESLNECDECGELMLNHYKNYVHGNGKLDMSIEKFEALTQEQMNFPNQRIMWSVCRECNYKTPVVPMSDDTYYFSIGKYFENVFWGKNVVLNSKCECQHDFFRNHIRYFSYNDMAIKVEYSPIESYEVVVPRKQIEYDTCTDVSLKVEALDSIRTKSTKFFNSISKRLNRVKVDTFDKAEDGAKMIEELKEKLNEQESVISTELLYIYNNTAPTTYLPLNSIVRKLQELGVLWDADFNDFETKFLPSENEITRITQFHLRNFLMDRYNNDGSKEVEMNDMSSKTTQNNDVNSTKSVNNDNEKEPGAAGDVGGEVELQTVDTKTATDNTETIPVDHLNDAQGKEIGKLIPRSLSFYNPHSNVGEKVNKMERFIESERLNNNNNQNGTNKEFDERRTVSSPLRKPPTTSQLNSLSHKASDASMTSSISQLSSQALPVAAASSGKSNSKVSQLASFFDQMNFDQISMEFKKQREKELKKNLNKFRAIPIVASKPIVEIYNKIEDVVDVDELDTDKRDKLMSRKSTVDSGLGKRDTAAAATAAAAAAASKAEEVVKNVRSLGSPSNIRDKEKEKDKLTDKLKDKSTTEKDSKLNKDKLLDIPQPERMSLLKSLTNFWADRSASLWDPLEYPLDSNEHTFADSDIIVREDEPSSLVAFCLSTNDYKQKIKSMGEDDLDNDTRLDTNEINDKKINSFAKIEKKFKNRFDNGRKPNDLEKIMNKNKSAHLKYQFTDGTTALSCKIFYSEQFEALRKSCGKEDRFIQSLSRCIKWNSSGGKSGSNFLKTLDNRYIVKELSKADLESFVSMAPFYFKYISQSMFNTLTTALAKIFGFYQIHIKNLVTGKTFKMDFLIMENLFYNNKTTRIFDLKGSMRNRHVTQTGRENEVLLDENMIEYIYESPLFVKEHLKKLLRGSLFNDTSFLSVMDVMDYSLIIGIDDSSKKLYIGIIDWLRTFTWDKKVENWVKGNNLIGGNKKGKDPTIVTPKQYRIRFREAMERYILEVPDIWYEGKH